MRPQDDVQAELQKAAQARARGNEGQARVCARRAAGLAARAYYARRGLQPGSSSAYDVLHLIVDDPLLPEEIRMQAAHLTLRVNEEFKMPPGMDLIAEARALCEALSAAPGAG